MRVLKQLLRFGREQVARRELHCSFCGRQADQVERLVAGPSVYICDACINKCVAVLEQHGGLTPTPTSR
jgi:ribosomal protein L37AE/L43A